MKLEIRSFQPARSSLVRSVNFPGGVKVKADTLNVHVWILWHQPPGLEGRAPSQLIWTDTAVNRDYPVYAVYQYCS